MKPKTLSEFVGLAGHIPGPLIRAVVRQVGGWDTFKEHAEDYTKGADGGWAGFTYYHDTVPFATRNKDAILEMAKAQADDLGSEDEFAMIAGFNCLRDMKVTPGEIARAVYDARKRTVRTQEARDVRTQVLNALAWYALEEVARAYCDLIEAD